MSFSISYNESSFKRVKFYLEFDQFQIQNPKLAKQWIRAKYGFANEIHIFKQATKQFEQDNPLFYIGVFGKIS